MFWIFKKNDKSKIERKKLYFDNIKEASLFLDKVILTLSSAFLGFLFSQLQNLLNSEIKLININYLNISIILIGLTIFFVLISYVATIDQANYAKDIDDNKGIKRIFGFKVKGKTKFNFLNGSINVLRALYFFSFIIAILLSIIFYITNLNNYVGQ
ncbi:MAG: hypothetical protein PHV23_05335 [Candidatus Gracilibacteria bacterium]|nr:hypothetical protein [Candidatus Gracilibacteria bacterium]